MIRARAAFPLAASIFLATACGPAVPPPLDPVEPQASAKVAAPAPPPPAPTSVAFGAAPADADLYAELSHPEELVAAAERVLGSATFQELRGVLAREAKGDAAMIEAALRAIASVHVAGKKIDGGVKIAGSVVLSDDKVIRDLIAAGLLLEGEPFGLYGRRIHLKGEKSKKDDPVWFAGPRLVAFGDDAMLERMAAVVEGKSPPLSEAQRSAAIAALGGPKTISAFVSPRLLDELADGAVTLPAPLSVGYDTWEGGIRGAFRAAIAARGFKGNVPLPSPRALALARRLPADTAGYLAISTGLPGGSRGASQLVAQLMAVGGGEARDTVSRLDDGLSRAGLRLVDLLAALGGEGVIGAVVRQNAKTKEDFEKGYAVVVALELADAKTAERALKLARDVLGSMGKKAKVRAEGTGFSAELAGSPLPFVRAKILGGADKTLFVGIGPKDLVDKSAAAIEKGKGTLGDDPAHARALSGMPANAQLRLWIDLGRAAEIAALQGGADQRAALTKVREVARGPKRITSGLSLSVIPEDDRVRFELDEVNGVGVFAALGIYGVRRYLQNSKIVEAKNTVGAITRAAVAAFEREQLGPNNTVRHVLCKSAQPVPAAVPRGIKFMPSNAPGTDWDTGDDQTGWRCLKFMMSSPHYYRYSFIAGGPYKGPARGGPDPGPDGFEVSAEGDLDGNGVTSLFTRVGMINRATGAVTIVPEVFVDKEYE
jgi:hypothetical protein